MKKMLIGLMLIMSTHVNAQWFYDGYTYSSNFCRNGPYYQFVQWNVVGTSCYMPSWNLYGTRVAE